MEDVIGIGTRYYDGRGAFNQVEHRKGATSGAALDQALSGTYEVNADCTGVMYGYVPGQTAPVEVRIVIVDNGKQINYLVLSPAFLMISGRAQRQ